MEPVVEASPAAVTLDVVKTPEPAPAAAVVPAAAPAAAAEAPAAAPAAAAEAPAAPAAAAEAPAAAAAAEEVKKTASPSKPKTIDAVFDAVTTDEKFLAAVKVSVDKILKDGKVDQSDVPELVFIISEAVNSLSSFHVTIDLVPVVIKMVYTFIVNKYNLVPEEKKPEFERIVDSSLRLLMLQPKVRKDLNACFAFLSCSK